MTKIRFLKIRDVKSPERNNLTDSGIDGFVPYDLEEVKITPSWEIRKIEDWKIILKSNEWALIPAWIQLIIENWYDIQISNKSGIATKRHLICWAEIVDNWYTGQPHYHMINVSNDIQIIELWDKIAQMIIRKVYNDGPKEINEEEFNLNAQSKKRWDNWFWSSWIK